MEVYVFVSLSAEFPNDNPALHRGVCWVCLEPTGRPQPERAAAAAPSTEMTSELASISPAAETLPPAADADVDDAGPIVVEELEPIEAVSVEGPITIVPPAQVSSQAAPEAQVTAIEAGAEHVDAAPLDAPPETIEPVAPAVEVEREVPAPAVSEIMLVARVAPEPCAGTPVEPDAVTPVFEEIVTSELSSRDSTELPPASDDPFTVLVCTLADVAIGAGSPHVAALLPGLMFDGRLPEPLDGDAEAVLRAAGLLLESNEIAPAFINVMRAWREILRGTSDDFDACGASMLDEWASDLLAKLLDAPARAPMLRQELRTRGVAAFGLAAA